ncbi:MAG: isocitrate/isopropylmalate dehydrogenase family protein [Geothrix sp.]|uniref:isocitrate/isopropylmalate dehydrogenase family protein n=1 Tax=Geothrix sp. TaxID=1962974 RepID=UPI00181FE4AA|nr:isocitrate/isopropylmalate family dehydrogenase [Geothrix sp.]NWJ40000.1 isocitrate/isopropylmalate dehydrogenase family protein [Geothrix sp.]WIL21990.1 MAG: isocitrate/isopropylmalate family dehydrogenase [Geothrix sp.]
MDKPIRIALIPGDGVGTEVMAEVLPCLTWARSRGHVLETLQLPYGAGHYLTTGETLPETAFTAIRDGCDAILFGAVGDPRIPDGRHAEAILLRLRQDLDLTVNFRPCRAWVPGAGPDLDLEVFRENTEGPYCLQGSTEPGRAVDLAIHTESAVGRLLTAAFQRAEALDRPLTLAHKANVLKHGHGLWMRVFEDLKPLHPRVAARGMHADALLCALVQDPASFGVIAADNYLGDLISDLCAAFIGGMGVAPSLSWAPHRPFRCTALAEPVHGSAPDIAGKGLANPVGMMLSTALLFRHLGWEPEAKTLEAAVSGALAAGAKTSDLGGTLSTTAMGKAIRDRLPS